MRQEKKRFLHEDLRCVDDCEQVRTASESLTRVYNHATFKNIGDGHTIADRSEHVREDGFLNFGFPRGEDDDSPKQLTEPRASQHRTF